LKAKQQEKHFMGSNRYPFQQVPWGQQTQNDFDVRTRKIMNGEQIVDDATLESVLETASPEQLRKLYNKVALSDQQKADMERSRLDANTFVKLHPEFYDTKENAHQVRTHAMIAFDTPHPDLAQLEAAYQACVVNGLVTLDQAELAKQADRDAASRAKLNKSMAFNEDDAYALPLEEVRHRANGGW
jgi:hypothetical protein